MFKKLFREIARPFEYASKAGSSETNETGRQTIGGQITGASSTIVLKCCDNIQLSQFDAYLQGKGINAQAVTFFQVLKHVEIGKREKSDFLLSRSTASLEKIGIAVQKTSANEMTIAIVWKKCTVSFKEPQTVINYVTRDFGLGWRNSSNSSNTIGRGLNAAETQSIVERLNQESAKSNLALQAEAAVSSRTATGK